MCNQVANAAASMACPAGEQVMQQKIQLVTACCFRLVVLLQHQMWALCHWAHYLAASWVRCFGQNTTARG